MTMMTPDGPRATDVNNNDDDDDDAGDDDDDGDDRDDGCDGPINAKLKLRPRRPH